MNSDALAQFITPLVLSIVALCAVVARVWARRVGKLPLGVDDYLIIASLVIALALAILLEWAAFNAGVGQPELQVVPYIYARYWTQDWITFVLNVLVVGLIKVSVICFYKRIFSGRRFLIVSNVLIAVSVAWMVYNVILSLILKVPLGGIWDINDTHPYTYNSSAGSIQSAATDIAIDLAILAVPIPLIRSLNTSKRRKLVFGLMFGLGAFCVIASLVRLIILVRFATDLKASAYIQSIDETALWAAIECYASIVAACLPTFGPLWSQSTAAKRVFGRFVDVIISPFLTRVSPTIRRLPSVPDDARAAEMMETGTAPGPSSSRPSQQAHQAHQSQPIAAASPDTRKWAHMWRQMNPETIDTMRTVTTVHEEPEEAEQDNHDGQIVSIATACKNIQVRYSFECRTEGSASASTHTRSTSETTLCNDA